MSVTCVIVIYTLTNVAYFAVLPKDLMLASPAVAVTFGNLTLGVMAWTIPVFVACSISGGLNGNTITYSRLLFVSARRGHLPRLLSLVHIENNTPVTSLIFLTLMSMLMFVTSDVRVLINYLAFAGNLMALMCISSFFWFRVKHPDWPRSIKHLECLTLKQGHKLKSARDLVISQKVSRILESSYEVFYAITFSER
ncbi:Y+L amino acid transporter 2 [Chionoecetes opilio]|uniref:Y+L amino acid transporter 2 n=1 Tax=Chionoecetes opilio TaxID=41210 RepID=A0A8J4YHS8_CHIOP|nr:Y+L amino acid transporter 2 [Chionoecetes opilio]